MILEPFRVVRPGVDVTITMQAAVEDDGARVAGIYNLEGVIALKPKAWLRAVRAELAVIEDIARKAGCTEMRIAGRKAWARLLPGYEPIVLPRSENGLRKKLT